MRLKGPSAPRSVFGSLSTTWSPSLRCRNGAKADQEVAERTGDDRRFFATDYAHRADDSEYAEDSVSPARPESLEEGWGAAIAVDQRLPAIAFQSLRTGSLSAPRGQMAVQGAYCQCVGCGFFAWMPLLRKRNATRWNLKRITLRGATRPQIGLDGRFLWFETPMSTMTEKPVRLQPSEVGIG